MRGVLLGRRTASGGGGAAPPSGFARVQGPIKTEFFGNTGSASYGSTPVAGHLLTASLGVGGNRAADVPAGWNLAVIHSISQATAALWWKISNGTESAVASTWSGNDNGAFELNEYSGNTATPLVATDSSHTAGFTSSITTGAVTLAGAGLVFTVVGIQYNATPLGNTWTNGFVRSAAWAIGIYESAYLIPTVGGTYSSAETWTGSAAAASVIAAFA